MRSVEDFGFEPAAQQHDFLQSLHNYVNQLANLDHSLPEYKTVLAELSIEWFVKHFELYIPSNLHDTLEANSPPSWEFWLSTPSAFEMNRSHLLKDWFAIYHVTMEHPISEKNLLYIGSASNETQGAQARIQHWNTGDLQPTRVVENLGKGFKITHMGIILLMKKPVSADNAFGRLWTLTLEALFTYRFWSVYQKKRTVQSGHHHAEPICSWNIDDLEWSGLNTHTPLRDPVAHLNLDLSKEGIARYQQELVARAERLRAYNVERGRRYNKIDEGRAVRKAYRESAEGRATRKEFAQRYSETAMAKINQKDNSKKYYQSSKGKAAMRRSNTSEKGKARSKKFEASEKRKAYKKKWRASAKGQESRKKYEQSAKGKAAQKRYDSSDKGKARRERVTRSGITKH